MRRVRKRPSTACLLGGVSLGERTQLGQQLGIHILVVAYRNTTYYSIKVLRSRCLVRWASHQDWALDVCGERGTRLLTPCRHGFCFPRGCAELLAKRKGVAPTHRAEVIASCSELLSLHCPRHPLLLALLPACAVSQVIMRQDCSAYAEEPLRTEGLLEAAHQYSVQDIRGPESTPAPATLPTRKWQFQNLPTSVRSVRAL